MKFWIKKRLGEGSTWLGLGTLVISLGHILKAKHVPEIGEQIVQSADQLATGDYITPLATAVLGGLTVLKSDKGNK